MAVIVRTFVLAIVFAIVFINASRDACAETRIIAPLFAVSHLRNALLHHIMSFATSFAQKSFAQLNRFLQKTCVQHALCTREIAL
jgi:hypothetical protein